MRAAFVFTLEVLAYGLVVYALWGISHELGFIGAGVATWFTAQGIDK